MHPTRRSTYSTELAAWEIFCPPLVGDPRILLKRTQRPQANADGLKAIARHMLGSIHVVTMLIITRLDLPMELSIQFRQRQTHVIIKTTFGEPSSMISIGMIASRITGARAVRCQTLEASCSVHSYMTNAGMPSPVRLQLCPRNLQ